MILNHAIGRPHAVDSEWLIDFSAWTTHSSSEHPTTFYTHLFLDPFVTFKGSSHTFPFNSTVKCLRLDMCLICRATRCLRKAADSVLGAKSVFHLRSPGVHRVQVSFHKSCWHCGRLWPVWKLMFLSVPDCLKCKKLLTGCYFLTSEHWSIS